MATKLFIADDDASLRRVRQFRYDIYVKELCFDHPDARHATAELYDALDAYSTIFALADDNGTIVATLRCTLLKDSPDPGGLIEKFAMEPFAERFSVNQLATTSRFMFRPDRRKGTDILKLLKASVELGLRENIRFNFGDTNPIWLDYFEQLGYRRFDKPVNDPVFGYHLPIVMLVRDLVYLRQAGSPMLRYIPPGDDDAEARQWFLGAYGRFLQGSPIGRSGPPPDGDWTGPSGAVASSEASALPPRGAFYALSSAAQRDVLSRLSLLEFYAGDQIVRKGEIDDTIYICLQGHLVQSDGIATDRPIGPGDVFGAEEYLEGLPARRTAVTATAAGRMVVLPARRVRELQLLHSEIGPWLAVSPAFGQV